MTKTLKAPPGVSSAAVEGHPIEIVDGVCEVTDGEAIELKAHGFTEITKGSNDDPRPPAEGEEMSDLDVHLAMLGRAERKEMFTIAKSMGVALTATLSTEQMREALIAETKKRAAPTETKPAEVPNTQTESA